MTITVERLPECRAAIHVQVPSDKVESQRAQITRLYHQSAKVPGFRPGKAPAAMIARRYAREIDSELRERLIREGYQEGSKQEGLEVLTPTEVKEGTFHVDGTFSFVVEVITAPDFELPEYKGIPIKAPKVVITDEHVDQAIHKMRQGRAAHDPVEGRPLAMGDVAVIDYVGLIDGKPIREFAAAAPEPLEAGRDYAVIMEEPNFLPGFCEALVGLAVGESRNVAIRLPEDFPVREIAGMEVVYEVTLREIKEVKLPELDDAFARETKVADDAASLPGAVRERLEADLRHRIEQAKREQVVGYLNEKAGFDVPQDLVSQATERRVQELVQSNQERGLSDDEIVEHQDEILAAAGQQAHYDVKTNFLLNRIATAEKIEATPEELKNALLPYAVRAKNPRQQLEKLMKNSRFIGRLADQVIARKTIDLLVENAIIKEVEAQVPESDSDTPA